MMMLGSKGFLILVSYKKSCSPEIRDKSIENRDSGVKGRVPGNFRKAGRAGTAGSDRGV